MTKSNMKWTARKMTKYIQTQGDWIILLWKNSHWRNQSGEAIKKFLESNENLKTTNLNLWQRKKEVLRGKVIASSAILKSSENSN